MKHYYQNLGENWFTYPKLYAEMVALHPSGSLFVEVGTWKGMSAAYMGVEIINSGKNIKLHCVDTWEYIPTQTEIARSKYTNLYETFLNNINPCGEVVVPVRGISWEMADMYPDESIDFVFIDAAHDYASVKKDLAAWYPKVKKGGIFAGHDYAWSADVRRAVDEFLGKGTITEQEGCWIYNKK
jgi:predicted O-methyltransferase YrrM